MGHGENYVRTYSSEKFRTHLATLHSQQQGRLIYTGAIFNHGHQIAHASFSGQKRRKQMSKRHTRISPLQIPSSLYFFK
jgi:hypothetical protein